jgi:hypothetical protein
MDRHTTLQKTANFFTPFMQPSGGYKFYGVTGFWKLAKVAVPDYEHASYSLAVTSLFNASTGYLNSPSTNDVVYDDALSLFKVWSGSSWDTISEATLNFSFNFSKYRLTWNIDQPDVVQFHDGTNTWFSSSETDVIKNWPSWKSKMDMIIASIHADNPDCKIIIGIPNSSGKQGLYGAAIFERANRAYFMHKKFILQYYDNREGENIFVNDYHSVVDRDYAFNITQIKPFEDFTGTERDEYKSDATHLSVDGYNQMGSLYYGLIQSFR